MVPYTLLNIIAGLTVHRVGRLSEYVSRDRPAKFLLQFLQLTYI